MIWSGLAMGQVFESDLVRMTNQCNTLLSYGITDIRVSLPDYTVNTTVFHNAIITALNLGMHVIWGVSSNPTVITAANWPAFRAKVLIEAQWCQDNGVTEFQIGNEEEAHVDNTTMTVATVRNNLKTLATDVQAIFTRGNVSYSPASLVNTAEWISAWNSLGKGDLDTLGLNVYRDTGSLFDTAWKTNIDNLYANWGTNCFISEWSVSYRSLNTWSTQQERQAMGIAEMLDYIQASGIPKAYFFAWESSSFGVFDGNTTYKLLWNILTMRNKRRWFDNI